MLLEGGFGESFSHDSINEEKISLIILNKGQISFIQWQCDRNMVGL